MKLIIDIDNNDYELINKTGVTLDLHTVFHGKDKDKEMTLAIFDLVKALKNGTPYEEKPKYFPPCEDCNKKMEEIRQAYDKMKVTERPQGDLISREALKNYARKVMYEKNATNFSLLKVFDEIIDNAPIQRGEE